MKLQLALLLVAGVCGALAAEEEWCYKNAVSACKGGLNSEMPAKCNAKYGAFTDVIQTHLNSYMKDHVDLSHRYLMMATHFGNYQKNRDGFKKLFREMSDHAWHKAIELVKYVTKRGGVVNFSDDVNKKNSEDDESYVRTEFGAMASAVDSYKVLAETAIHIHREVSKSNKEHHDPEVASYIENEFVHKHSEKIRELTAHTNDLQKLIGSSDRSLALYTFNEYLLKH